MAAPTKMISGLIFCIFVLNFDVVVPVDPVSVGLVVGGSAVLGGVALRWGSWAVCTLQGECCDSSYITPDFSGLAALLDSELYGQHLVKQAVVRALKGHHHVQPSKALALSFHGMTGSGKNHVSRMIAQKIYKKGMRSSFVHFFSATHHFPHAAKINDYKEDLRNKIIEGAKACGRALFIFDEMDKMPPTLIDTIAPYLDYHEHIEGTDFRKTTFIFLSNAAGSEISRMSLEFWRQGHQREDIKLNDLQSLITVGAFNDEGGWWHNVLMEKHLISVFVPFLPLEKQHVKKCVVNELSVRATQCDPKIENCSIYKPTQALVNKIADSLSYFPKSSPVFATSGCKRITDQVTLILLDEE